MTASPVPVLRTCSNGFFFFLCFFGTIYFIYSNWKSLFSNILSLIRSIGRRRVQRYLFHSIPDSSIFQNSVITPSRENNIDYWIIEYPDIPQAIEIITDMKIMPLATKECPSVSTTFSFHSNCLTKKRLNNPPLTDIFCLLCTSSALSVPNIIQA